MSPESLDGLEELPQEVLRKDLLYGAHDLDRYADMIDRQARRHAVDQFIQYFTDEGDIPIATKRVLLTPHKPEATINGITEAYVYYPKDELTFVDAEGKPRVIFIRTIMADGGAKKFLITPDKLLTFSDNDEIEIDLDFLDLADLQAHDPSSIFTFRASKSFQSQMTEKEESDCINTLNKIVRTYGLKAQPPKHEQKAS